MQFGILGPLQVVDGGRRMDLGAHRQRAVLAILVLHADEVVSLDRLIDLLWGHTPPNAATGSLQAYVSNLRRVLEPNRQPRQPAEILVTEAPGYRLRVDREGVDAFRFERLVDQARGLLVGGAARAAIELLDEARSLWRGEALAEFRYEDFAAVEVARLDELRVAAEEDRAEALLAAGNHAAAVRSLDRLVPHHPLRERLQALRMLALYRSGRQTEALRVYDDTRRTLADELGLSPGPQLQRLVAQVLEQSPALLDQTRDLDFRPAHQPSLPPRPLTTLESDSTAGEPAVRLHGRSFVGRAREVRALEGAIRDAAAGRTRFALVGGEPGIGKTRLVEHVVTCADRVDVRAAWGRCHDDDGFPPLWPWVQVMQTLQGGDAGGQTAHAKSLADLLEIEDNGEPSNPELARFRLYESVRAFVQQAAQSSPVVIVLDDLQWADPASLRLLRYLAVELRSARVLVVGTFHEPDPSRDSPLASALADLARRPNVDRLSIRGLAVADVADLVRLDTPVDDESVDTVAAELHRRTEGNAFFLTELVRLLESEDTLQRADDAADIPLVVRDVVHRRLGRLPDDAQVVLGVAAVIGREFSLDVLHQAAGLSADEVSENLEAAVIASVVIETDPGWYRFSHGLMRETLYTDLTPGRRARLHAKVAGAMESVYGEAVEDHASQLAHHFHAARETVPAARYSELAAEQSERSLAYDDAVAHWESAIRARDQGGGDDAAERARLLLRLAAAHRGAGDAATSAEVQDQALEAAEASGDPALLAEAALAYGEVGLWQVRPYGTVDERVADAISRLLDRPIDPDDPLRARLLTGLAVALYYRESERERGRDLARQAVSVSRRVGDPQFLAAALVELIVMLEGEAEAEQVAVAQELHGLLDADLSFEVESTARMRLARVRLSRGDGTAFEREINDVWRRAEEQRQPIVRLWITWARTAEAFLRGRLAEAEELASSAFELHNDLGLWGGPETYALHMTLIWREQERLGEVAPLVEPLLEQSQHPGAYKLRALFALERDAASEIETILGPDPVPTARDFTWLVEMCLTAELCAAAGLSCSEELYDQLLPLAGHVATMDGTYVCLGATSHYLGLLADTLGRRADAIVHLEEALVVHDRIGAVPWAVRTRVHLARLLPDEPHRRRALLDEALVAADASGLVSMRRRIVALGEAAED